MGQQSGCGVCTETQLLDSVTTDVVAHSSTPFFWYTCGTPVSINITTNAGPLVSGKSYIVSLAVWSISPTDPQCPPAGNISPITTTVAVINTVPPPQ